MSEENKTKFGNIPLGRINEMLVDFIGEDAFLDYCEKHHKDWGIDWQSREAFSKRLKRLFEEKESSYRDLNPLYDPFCGTGCRYNRFGIIVNMIGVNGFTSCTNVVYIVMP